MQKTELGNLLLVFSTKDASDIRIARAHVYNGNNVSIEWGCGGKLSREYENLVVQQQQIANNCPLWAMVYTNWRGGRSVPIGTRCTGGAERSRDCACITLCRRRGSDSIGCSARLQNAQ